MERESSYVQTPVPFNPVTAAVHLQADAQVVEQGAQVVERNLNTFSNQAVKKVVSTT